jgi:ABC-type multidrug transport system fused ATPase/permease subunit
MSKLNSSIFSVMKESLSILPRADKRRYLNSVLAQSFLGFFDLLGVAIFGVIGALTVRGIQSQDPGANVKKILSVLGIDGQSFQAQVAILGIIAVVALLSKTVINMYLTRKILHFLSYKSAQISSRLVSRLLSKPLIQIQENSTFDIQYAVGSGVNSIALGILGIGLTIISDISLLIIVGLGVFVINPVIAVSSTLIFGLISFVLHKKMNSRSRKIGQEIAELNVKTNQKLNEIVTMYREFYITGRRGLYVNEIQEMKLKFANSSAEQAFMPNISKYVFEAAITLGAVLVAAITFVTQDASGAFASLAIFMAAASRLTPALLRIQQSFLQIQSNRGSAESTLKMIQGLDSSEDVPDSQIHPSFYHNGFIPEIEIKNASFSYSETSDLVVDNLSIHIKAGEFVAIVGPSGSGKTTLVDLILGVHSPNHGAILISGMSSDQVIQRWPGAIGYVPQIVGMINSTVKSNVALGFSLENVDDESVWAALKSAKLEAFVKTLPFGILESVGESGSRISGGQRQRLGIARALFTNPKLVILDEATSSLDGETELAIASSLQELKGNVTIVMIAHRLSTVRDADKVIYIENGTVKAVGTFEDVRSKVPHFDLQAQIMGL